MEREGFRIEQRVQTPHSATDKHDVQRNGQTRRTAQRTNTTYSATDNESTRVDRSIRGAQSAGDRPRPTAAAAAGAVAPSSSRSGSGGTTGLACGRHAEHHTTQRTMGIQHDVGSRARHAGASRAAGPRQTSAGSPSRRSPWPYSLAPAAPRSAGAKAQSSFGSTASRNVRTAVVFNASLGDAASTHSRWLEGGACSSIFCAVVLASRSPSTCNAHCARSSHHYSCQRPARV